MIEHYLAQHYLAQHYLAQHYLAQHYLAQHYLAQQPPPNAPEFGGSSPIGLVVILALFVVTFFLVRSMNKHLKKVPASFDQTSEESRSGAPAATRDAGDPDAGDGGADGGRDGGAGDGPKTTTAQ